MTRLFCGIECRRTLFAILNIAFVISSFTLLAFGIYLNVREKLDVEFLQYFDVNFLRATPLHGIGHVLIVFAVFTILLCGFGCVGAVFQNRLFLYLYAVILSLLIIAELVTCIVIFSSPVTIRDHYHDGFREFFKQAYGNSCTDLIKVIEDIERQLQCCGADNVRDYYNGKYAVPVTCHRDADIFQPIFDQGCASAAVDWLWTEVPLIGSVLGTILLVEIFGVVSAIALAFGIAHPAYEQIYD